MEKELVRVVPYQAVPDDKCFLPHTLAQNALFTLARDPGVSFEEAARLIREGRGIAITLTNLKGDKVVITAPRQLYCTPDMGVFLAVLAAAQQAGINEYKIAGKTNPVYFTKFDMAALYEILDISSKKALWRSMSAVGATRIDVTYAKPSDHGEQQTWSSKSFWEMEYFPRRGKCGGHIEAMFAPCLVPQKHYLWVNAVELNRLRSDTARAVYWALLSREHWALTIADWKKVLRSTDPNERRWQAECFIPALRELADRHGFSWSTRDTRNGTAYVVKRPSRGRFGGVAKSKCPQTSTVMPPDAYANAPKPVR